MESPERARAFPRHAEVALLILIGFGAIAFQLRVPRLAVDDGSYEAVAAVLRTEGHDGDVVLLQPWWTEKARLRLRASLPIVGFQGSAAEPFTEYRRIWVLAEPDLPRAQMRQFESAFLPHRSVQTKARRFGRLELTLYENGRHRPVHFMASTALAGAHVSILDARTSQTVDCVVEGSVHHCPGSVEVATEWHEVLFAPRRCLFVRPPEADKKLRITFPAIEQGDTLSLRAGYIWDRGAQHGPGLSATHVRVEGSTGQTLAEIVLPVGLEGWQRQDISRKADRGPVTLTVDAANPDLREVCIDLWSVDGEGRG